MAWVHTRLCKLQKGCTRLAAANDKVYQLLAHGRWLSPASSTTKTGRHDIAESGIKHNKSNQSNQTVYIYRGNWIYSDHQIMILIYIYKRVELDI